MRHPEKVKLLVYLDENAGDLTDTQLSEYLYLAETLTQQIRDFMHVRKAEHECPTTCGTERLGAGRTR